MSPTPVFLIAISPSNETWLPPVKVLSVYFPSGPIGADRMGTILPELAGLKRIDPPVAGTPLTETTPLTVASVSDMSTLGLPSPQPGLAAYARPIKRETKPVRHRELNI